MGMGLSKLCFYIQGSIIPARDYDIVGGWKSPSYCLYIQGIITVRVCGIVSWIYKINGLKKLESYSVTSYLVKLHSPWSLKNEGDV